MDISNHNFNFKKFKLTDNVNSDNAEELLLLQENLSIFEESSDVVFPELTNAQIEETNIPSEMTVAQQSVGTENQNLANAHTIAGHEFLGADGSILMDYSARDVAKAQVQAQVAADLQRYEDIVTDIDAFEAELATLDADIFSTQAEITALREEQQVQEPIIPNNQEEQKENKAIGGLTEEELTQVQDAFVEEINNLISKYYPDKKPEEVTDGELEQMLFLEGIKGKTADMQGNVEAYYATEGWADSAYNWIKDTTGKGLTREDLNEYVENENYKNAVLETALKNGTITVINQDMELSTEDIVQYGVISKETINEIISQKIETYTSFEEIMEYTTTHLGMSEEEAINSVKKYAKLYVGLDFELEKNDEGKYIFKTDTYGCAHNDKEFNSFLKFHDEKDFASNLAEYIVADYTNKQNFTFEEMYSFFTGVKYSEEAIEEVANIQPAYNNAMSTYTLANNQEVIFANASSPSQVLEYFEEVYDCSREESIQMFNAYYENMYEKMKQDGFIIENAPREIILSSLKLSGDGKELTAIYQPTEDFNIQYLENSDYVYNEETNTVTWSKDISDDFLSRPGDPISVFQEINSMTDVYDYLIKDAIETFDNQYAEEYGTFDNVIKSFNEAYTNAYGNNILNEKFNEYQLDMDTYAAKLAGGISTVGFALSFANPVFGWAALVGAFTDNTIDFVNLSTNQVEDEFGAWALDTGKDVLLTIMGMKLGKFAAGAGERATANLFKKGMDFAKSKVLGVAAEVGIDFATGYAMDAGVVLASLYMQDGKLDMEKYQQALKDNIFGNLMSCGMDIRGGIAAYRAINASRDTGSSFNYEFKDGTYVSYNKENGGMIVKPDGSMDLVGKDNQRFELNNQQVLISEVKENGQDGIQNQSSLDEKTKVDYTDLIKETSSFVEKSTGLGKVSTVINKPNENPRSDFVFEDEIKKLINEQGLELKFDDEKIQGLSKLFNSISKRLSASNIKITDEELFEIVKAGEFYNASDIILTVLSGQSDKQYIGRAYFLAELKNSGVITNDMLYEISKNIDDGKDSVSRGFTLAFNENIAAGTDYFSGLLKDCGYNDKEINSFLIVADLIAKGEIPVSYAKDIKSIISIIDSEMSEDDIKFFLKNLYDNPYYTPEEFVQTFNYFKNLTTPDGKSILGAEELSSKLDESISKETLYSNIRELMNINPSSVEASYIYTFLELIQLGEINPSALCFLDNLRNWSSNEVFCEIPLETENKWALSPEVKSDIDLLYDVIINNKNKANLSSELAQAYTPKVSSEMEGIAKVETGDAFVVEGEDYIRIKISDTESSLMNITKETYYKLFPPIERFASSQQALGDCYCIETFMSLYSNKTQRANIVSFFSEVNGDVVVNLPNGRVNVTFKNAEMPVTPNEDVYSSGAEGFRMLEYAYSVNLVENLINKVSTSLPSDKLVEFTEFIETNGNNVFIYEEDGSYKWTTFDNAVSEELYKTAGIETGIEKNHYNSFNEYLLGNAGIQKNVLDMLGYSSEYYLDTSNVEIDTLKELGVPDDQIQYYKDSYIEQFKIFGFTDAEIAEANGDLSYLMRKFNAKISGMNVEDVKSMKSFNIEALKSDEFYDNHIVQISMQQHAWSLTKGVDETGQSVHYLYNPHNQALPIKIYDIDEFFSRKGVVQAITISSK